MVPVPIPSHLLNHLNATGQNDQLDSASSLNQSGNISLHDELSPSVSLSFNASGCAVNRYQ